MLYEIWEDEENNEITLKRADQSLEKTGIKETAVMVHSFDAKDYNDACQKQYDFYGWGKYTPMD